MVVVWNGHRPILANDWQTTMYTEATASVSRAVLRLRQQDMDRVFRYRRTVIMASEDGGWTAEHLLYLQRIATASAESSLDAHSQQWNPGTPNQGGEWRTAPSFVQLSTPFYCNLDSTSYLYQLSC